MDRGVGCMELDMALDRRKGLVRLVVGLVLLVHWLRMAREVLSIALSRMDEFDFLCLLLLCRVVFCEIFWALQADSI